MRSPTRLGWVEMAVGLPEDLSYPEHSPRNCVVAVVVADAAVAVSNPVFMLTLFLI